MAKKEPEVREDRIRVSLGDEFWIDFRKEWDNLDARRFRNSKDDLIALRMVVEQALDWNIPRGKTWEPLAFDKPNLIAQIDAFLKDETQECWSVPSQFVGAMVTAYYDAYIASCKLPFVNASRPT